MRKRSIIAITVAILLLSIFGLTSCASDVDEATGQFYTLQEAYDNALLTVEDLQSISYYQSVEQQEPSFTPIPKYPENLSDETMQAIKYTYLVSLLAQLDGTGNKQYPHATMKDVFLKGYFGTYRDAIAVKITNAFVAYPDVVVEKVIAGVTFTYSGAPISIWVAN